MAKIAVAVLMGGPSREHEVSLNSGQAICAALTADKYEVHQTAISLLGKWKVDGKDMFSAAEAIENLKKNKVDIVFLALHGSFGEDGTIQALLEKYGLKYTGSGVAASLLAMDKVLSGEMFSHAGLLVPKSITFTRYEMVQQKTLQDSLQELTYPVIVKPAKQGSSVGVTLVDSVDDLLRAVNFAFEHDNQIIVQEYIQGREVSCGILERGAQRRPEALAPTELKPVGADFFDYYAKYTPGATEEITPPDMLAATIREIQKTALSAHEILGCSGYSRTDMILKDNKIYVIETNTLPGMTKTSIFPQQAAAQNMAFPELVDQIITNGINRAL